MTATANPSSALDAFVQLDRRVRDGRTRIDEARERDFDVTAWESHWHVLRAERDALADELFRDRQGEAIQ